MPEQKGGKIVQSQKSSHYLACFLMNKIFQIILHKDHKDLKLQKVVCEDPDNQKKDIMGHYTRIVGQLYQKFRIQPPLSQFISSVKKKPAQSFGIMSVYNAFTSMITFQSQDKQKTDNQENKQFAAFEEALKQKSRAVYTLLKDQKCQNSSIDPIGKIKLIKQKTTLFQNIFDQICKYQKNQIISLKIPTSFQALDQQGETIKKICKVANVIKKIQETDNLLMPFRQQKVMMGQKVIHKYTLDQRITKPLHKLLVSNQELSKYKYDAILLQQQFKLLKQMLKNLSQYKFYNYENNIDIIQLELQTPIFKIKTELENGLKDATQVSIQLTRILSIFKLGPPLQKYPSPDYNSISSVINTLKNIKIKELKEIVTGITMFIKNFKDTLCKKQTQTNRQIPNHRIQIPNELVNYLNIIQQLVREKQSDTHLEIQNLKYNWIDICRFFLPQKQPKTKAKGFSISTADYNKYKDCKEDLIKQFHKLKEQIRVKSNVIKEYSDPINKKINQKSKNLIDYYVPSSALKAITYQYKDIIIINQQYVKELSIKIDQLTAQVLSQTINYNYLLQKNNDLSKQIYSVKVANQTLIQQKNVLKYKIQQIQDTLNEQKQKNNKLADQNLQLIKQVQTLLKDNDEKKVCIQKMDKQFSEIVKQQNYKNESEYNNRINNNKYICNCQRKEINIQNDILPISTGPLNSLQQIKNVQTSNELLSIQLSQQKQLLQKTEEVKMTLFQDLQQKKAQFINQEKHFSQIIAAKQTQIDKIKQENNLNFISLEEIIQKNKISEVQESYTENISKGIKNQEYFKELMLALKEIITTFKIDRQKILFEKAEERTLRHQAEDEVNKLKSSIKSLSQERNQIQKSLTEKKQGEESLLQQIQELKIKNPSLDNEIKRLTQIINIMTQEIQQKNQEKEHQNMQIQFLQKSIHQKHNAELERERQHTIKYLFDARGCLDNSQQAFTIKQSIVQQIERINNKKVRQTRLIYQYSPQTKLQWTHFVNKPQFLMLIRTQNQRIIAIYSQSSIMKPPFSHDKREDIAFIFQSNLKGEFAEFYPLLQGRSINGSYGNSVAFGKSDLRFSLGDTVIEGNFGYQGTLFDTKGKKIADLLGVIGGNKVKMLSYEMYVVELGEQIELKIQNTKGYVNAEMQLKQRKVDIQINKSNGGEQLKTLQTAYDRQKAILNRTIVQLQQKLKVQNKQITIKSQECEQLKADIKVKQFNISEMSQRFLQSDRKYFEIDSSLQQSQAKYTELQKQKTHLTTVFNEAQNQIENLRSIQANLNSQIAALSAKHSSSEQSATLQKTHEKQNNKLKEKYIQSKKQRQLLQSQFNEASKANRLYQTQICEFELTISELKVKIQQYEYNQSGEGQTKEVLLVEREDSQKMLKLEQQIKQHRQSLKKKQREIIQLTSEFNQEKSENQKTADKNNELLERTMQLERAISHLNQLQLDNQSMVTKITEQSLQIEKINSENKQLKKNNQSLEQKLTETISLNEKANNQLGVNNQNLRLSQSATTQLQSYKKRAETYSLDPFLIAQYDKSFETQVLCGQLEHKITLIRHLQLRMHQTFSSARLVYHYDPHNPTIYHKYIDGLDSLLCVVKTIHGVLLAGYYSGAYVQNEILNKPGCLISITNNESYDLHNEKTHPSQRAFRGMIFNEYFIIFGNAEIRIRANEKTVFSNFGIAASFFNPRNKKVHDLLGEGENRQIEFESYELYQVTFEKQEEQAK